MNTLRIRKLCGVATIVSCCATAVSCSPDSVKRSAGSTTSGVTKTASSPRSGVSSGNARSPGAASSSKSGVSRRLPVKPSVAPPARPAGMALVSSQGAIAAAEHYLNLTAYVGATGDFTELEAMSGPDCKFCRKFLSGAKRAHQKGDWTTVPKVSFMKHQEGEESEGSNKYWVNVVAHKEKFRLIKADGSQREQKAEDLLFVFLLHYDNGWKVEQLDAGSPSKWREVG